ncbi:PhzF family phenazine biosynthesis protein [Pseudoalteromonas umbrosa]|uniref:PhzF family phenazine biosynthesis protein n=1 Tax=Pseudoalteromonas umbrosa TaxID=3048489 RepID=UPI0024C2E98E|nr:PhzF family phenazine biosynthesis protein [Pseudoalteromonas sp. B95]MDK1286181.1 PhzF family phenazine biosynthesis protein [Pseudoalteromonas sp. B95]
MKMCGIRRVFCSEHYLGNLADVNLCDDLNEFHDTHGLQKIANNNKVAATAFLVKYANSRYRIRWFSPYGEIQFCGHATLAAADVLTSTFTLVDKEIIFESSNQTIRVSHQGGELFVMCLPQASLEITTDFDHIFPVFNQTLSNIKHTEPHDGYFVAQAANMQDLIELDFNAKEYIKCTRRALLVTTNHGLGSDGFYFRYFAPQYGSKEDQATGSAAPLLASYWQIPANKIFNCYQLSVSGGYYQIYKSAQQVCVIAKVLKLDD